jgi:hypothetical protein
MAGGEGFEPSTPNLGGKKIDGLDVDQFKEYLYNKYCRSYASQILNFVCKNGKDFLENPSKLLTIKPSVRGNALKSMVCLAKYLGCYEEYKGKLKSHGIKWTNEDTAFNGFLSIFSKQHDTLPQWVKEATRVLHDNERLFLRFLATTGLRKNEGITSFNMVIELNSAGKLCEYYNEELNVLEHFKYGKLFLRDTKNAYISFVTKALIKEICRSQPVSNYAIHSRLDRKHLKMRFKELRSYHNSYLRKHGIISELVDVLAGRVPKTVFVRHYLGEEMNAFSNQVLFIEKELETKLLSKLVK